MYPESNLTRNEIGVGTLRPSLCYRVKKFLLLHGKKGRMPTKSTHTHLVQFEASTYGGSRFGG
jgi:hypothetical protein